MIATAANNEPGEDAAILRVTLPVDGTYHILVQAAPDHPTSTGRYRLGVEDATVHTMPAGPSRTIYGCARLAVQRGSLDLRGERQPSGRLRPGRRLERRGIEFDLTGPGGSVVFAGQSASTGPLTLPATGTYTLAVSAAKGA